MIMKAEMCLDLSHFVRDVWELFCAIEFCLNILFFEISYAVKIVSIRYIFNSRGCTMKCTINVNSNSC